MLTPEQTADLVEWAGSQRAAAREVGVNESTIRFWLDPDPRRQRDLKRKRERYHNDPEYRERSLKRKRERYRNDPEFRERERQRQRERQRERYYRLRDEGLCTKCEAPRLSEALCWDCLNNMESGRQERNLKRALTL